MTDQSSSLPLQALPDGKAELRLVLQLSWEDLAALGQEAGRLAGKLQRTVSLDEAASYRLSRRPVSPAPAPASSQERTAPAASAAATPTPLTQRSGTEAGRQAIERGERTSATTAATGAAPTASASGSAEERGSDSRGTLERLPRTSSTAGRTAGATSAAG